MMENENLIGNIGFGERVEIERKAKKVLITGENSYIGNSFLDYAKMKYPELVVDVIDMLGEKWRNANFSKYDIVFHVAGLAHADVGNVSEEIKQKYYDVNTKLAIEVCKKAKAEGVHEFIFMSSMIIYGDAAPCGRYKQIEQDTVPQPSNFYGDSKLQADVAIRGMADSAFKVIVLRPPMIYGKNSKGNYPVLSKFAKNISIFPEFDNKRSMLHIDNLCECLCKVMLLKNISRNAVVLLPQNKEFVRTCDLVKKIAGFNGKKMKTTKLFNPVIFLLSKNSGKLGVLINKVFGSFFYTKEISEYEGLDYVVNSFDKSIKKTECSKKTITKVGIINCFDTYEHRVDLLYKYFVFRGNQVEVISSDFRHFAKTTRTDLKKNYTFVHAIPYKKNMSLSRMWSHFILSKRIFHAVKNKEFDLLWVLLPPNCFARQAARYKRKNNNTRLVYDVIDLWPETMPIARFKSFPPFCFWKSLRDRYLCYADSIVTECALYRKSLPAEVEGKMSTLYLAREKKDWSPVFNLPEDKLALCYLGSINNIIDISAIVELISNLQRIKPVVVHIIGDGENREEFISAIKTAGAETVYHGKVYDGYEKQRIFDSCHYGLNYMKESVVVGLTMKSMDYLEAGVPLLNNIHGDTWEFVEEYQIGFNVGQETDFEKIVNYDTEIRRHVRSFFEQNFIEEIFNECLNNILEEI